MSASYTPERALDLQGIPVHRASSVALDAITVAQQQHARQNRRPKALTAREALTVLQFESTLVWVAAHTLANGQALKPEDLERLTLACRRIDTIAEEAL